MKSNDIDRMKNAAKSTATDWNDEYYIPNCIGSQIFIDALGVPVSGQTWTIDGVTITAKTRANKAGLPDGCRTFRYQFAGPGWTVTVDAVWLDGRLYKKDVHTRVKLVRPNTVDARRFFNAWLTGPV